MQKNGIFKSAGDTNYLLIERKGAQKLLSVKRMSLMLSKAFDLMVKDASKVVHKNSQVIMEAKGIVVQDIANRTGKKYTSDLTRSTN